MASSTTASLRFHLLQLPFSVRPEHFGSRRAESWVPLCAVLRRSIRQKCLSGSFVCMMKPSAFAVDGRTRLKAKTQAAAAALTCCVLPSISRMHWSDTGAASCGNSCKRRPSCQSRSLAWLSALPSGNKAMAELRAQHGQTPSPRRAKPDSQGVVTI